MNAIPAQEIKRRGIAAGDELIAKSDVHLIRNNQPQYVVLSEACYQALLEAKGCPCFLGKNVMPDPVLARAHHQYDTINVETI